VDDREGAGRKAFGLLEVAREPAGDRDLPRRQPRNGSVGGRDGPAGAELVEAVLAADAHRHARERRGRQPVEVGVEEVRVHDLRPVPPDRRDEPAERARVGVAAQAQALHRHVPRT